MTSSSTVDKTNAQENSEQKEGGGYYCPICKITSNKFLSNGVVPRPKAVCPECGSKQHHRLVWSYLEKKTNLFNKEPKSMLHVAPEPAFQQRLENHLGDSYITADLYKPDVKVKMDVTDIQYPDNSFDIIYCCHVLEHVVDDRRAMREFYRVLKTSGWAIIMVSISVEKTFEDPTIVDPDERLRLFGQEDHVRRYGPDYADRLMESGFSVKIVVPNDFLTDEEIIKLAIKPRERLFICNK